MSNVQVPFKVGQAVKARLSNKRGTVVSVPEAAGNGLVEVRFDGDTGSVVLHHTRFEAFEVKKINLNEWSEYLFKRGDYLKVKSEGVSYKGAALGDLKDFGFSAFTVLTEDGQLLDFNYNLVEVEVLFRADIARGEDPTF